MVYLVWITYIALQLIVTGLGYIAILLIMFFITEKIEPYLERWKIKRRNKRWRKEHAKLVERWDEITREELRKRQERELYKIEKRKYPLFYLKDGIV